MNILPPFLFSLNQLLTRLTLSLNLLSNFKKDKSETHSSVCVFSWTFSLSAHFFEEVFSRHESPFTCLAIGSDVGALSIEKATLYPESVFIAFQGFKCVQAFYLRMSSIQLIKKNVPLEHLPFCGI